MELAFFRKIVFIYLLTYLPTYLFIERGKGREKERERNINVWLLLKCLQPGTWPATQTCALTGNQTSNHLLRRLAFNPLSHTNQG